MASYRTRLGRMAAKKRAKSRSGPNLSDDRRSELGYERLTLRPPAGFSEDLDELVAHTGETRTEAVVTAVRERLERQKR